MAFANKIGSLLKRSVGSNPSVFNAIRCMSSSKIFVGGVAWGTDDHSLAEAFGQHGQVVEAKVIVDRETGRSRGFGFVTFTTPEEASNAIAAQDGKELHGRTVRVNYANDRVGGGFGGGGGGFGGGGYGGGGGAYGGGGYGGGGGGGYGGGGYGGGGSYNSGGLDSTGDGGYNQGSGGGGSYNSGGLDSTGGGGYNQGSAAGYDIANNPYPGNPSSAGGFDSVIPGNLDGGLNDDEPEGFADKRS